MRAPGLLRTRAAGPADARPSVLLLSSDLRRRYAEDVLTALALPRGAVIQFRYKAGYVARALQRAVADRSVVGRRCLLGFVADAQAPAPLFPTAQSPVPQSPVPQGPVPQGPASRSPGPPPFVVPVRLAVIVAAVRVADMFVFRLRVDDYANLDDFPLTEAEIRERGASFVAGLEAVNGARFYPATARFPDPLPPPRTRADDPHLWLGVARRLAQHPTFRSSYFVRVEEPVLGDDRRAGLDAAGRLSLSDSDSVKVRVTFYADGYCEPMRQLACATDGTYLKISSDWSYDLSLRYDTVEFWLQPEALAFDALARVTIRLAADGQAEQAPGSLTTKVGFPVVVHRSRSRLFLRVSANAAGAFLVALPAVLGPSFPLHLRMLSAVTGAVLLALATIVISRGGR